VLLLFIYRRTQVIAVLALYCAFTLYPRRGMDQGSSQALTDIMKTSDFKEKENAAKQPKNKKGPLFLQALAFLKVNDLCRFIFYEMDSSVSEQRVISFQREGRANVDWPLPTDKKRSEVREGLFSGVSILLLFRAWKENHG
jgi:hypothetical protein